MERSAVGTCGDRTPWCVPPSRRTAWGTYAPHRSSTWNFSHTTDGLTHPTKMHDEGRARYGT
ncbi:MAG: hypothetical protein ACK523_03980, partial [Pirellulaceae bacterium]